MNTLGALLKKDKDARVIFISLFLAVLLAAATLIFAVWSKTH